MRVYKESKTGRWFVDYFFRGERLRYKAGSSMKAAKALRLRIESEMNAGKHNPAALREEVSGGGLPGRTLGKLVETFLSSYKSRGESNYYATRARVWLDYFGPETPVVDIGPLQVERFRNERLEVAGPSTVRKDLISLGTLFRWALGKGLCSENPADPIRVKRPSEPAGREVFLTDKEVARLLECCPKDLRRLVAWLVETGMRLSEPLKLRWADLDKRTDWVYVAPGKTGKGRRIPYSDRLRAIAEAGPRHLRGKLVFCGPEGEPLDPNAMSKQIKAAMVSAKLPEASAHSLRHTFASRLATRGVPMQAIADLLGQGAATTTARYMHLQPEHLRQAMRALEGPPPKLHGSNVATEP
jgi:integrase